MSHTHRSAMTLFSTHRLKRRIASAMVAIWLFVLGAAGANACLLQNRTTHLEPSTVATAGPAKVSAGHVGIEPGHAQDQSPGEPTCLKWCDDASQSIFKWQLNTELPDIFLLPSFTIVGLASVHALHAPQPVRRERPARTELPLRTRYVRLAL